MALVVAPYPPIKIGGYKMVDVFNRTGRMNPPLQHVVKAKAEIATNVCFYSLI